MPELRYRVVPGRPPYRAAGAAYALAGGSRGTAGGDTLGDEPVTPTARTLVECRRRGWRAQVVERYNRFARRRVDLFGCVDLVVLDGQPGVLGIQATTSPHVSDRVNKIRDECREAMAEWLAAGNRLEVWGYAQRGAKGARKLWTLRVVIVTLEMLDESAILDL